MEGGLILSQVLTRFTTPVIYLYLDGMVRWMSRVAGPALVNLPGWREVNAALPFTSGVCKPRAGGTTFMVVQKAACSLHRLR